MKNIIIFFTLLFCSIVSSGQSIVNTEKLFTNNDEGLGVSAEFSGRSISGNASVLLLGYSLNFSYKKNKNYFRLLSGGQYINKDRENVSNSLFTQFRYNYFINNKSRFFSFIQVQSNAILLIEKRLLGGAGYRHNIVDLKNDSSSKFSLDISTGIIQEEEILKRENLPSFEEYYTNYTRAIFSLVGIVEIKDKFTLVNTTYFQQYVLDFSDFRLLNETNLMVKINQWLSISLDLEYRFDSQPPSVLKDQDFNTNIGLVFNI